MPDGGDLAVDLGQGAEMLKEMLKVLRQKKKVASSADNVKTLFAASQRESSSSPARHCLLRQIGESSVSHLGAVAQVLCC